MLLSLRQIKRRIRSVDSTKKITRAMQMVSTAKLKHAQDMLFAGKPYYFKMDALLKKLLASAKTATHPLLEERPVKNNFTLCVVTSDSGLCSTYNDNIIRIAEGFINKHGAENTRLITIGKKGFSYFKKRKIKITHAYLGLQGRYSNEIAEEVIKTVVNAFLSKETDEVHIAHTHFDATLKYRPELQKLLNIDRVAEEREVDYILEPSAEKILEELIPAYISAKVKGILLDAFTSEHSQRMIAMKSATDNAVELIDNLTLLRNKARQAAITAEIIEVSSAAEALKG
ncbi:MAG: ATP synthase F1 subunit gamma [Candidatus Omnitrophota bacterium]|nr:ATP synthase F1 subunit gamma [Candidatus Omnitrophota bacterium]